MTLRFLELLHTFSRTVSAAAKLTQAYLFIWATVQQPCRIRSVVERS